MPSLRIPRSTYRLQMNADFTFESARGIVAFLDELGISDIYSSPILKARTGSTHGYDVVDPNALNPELGTEEEFARLTAELRGREMGFVLDTVPNHMAATWENPWWASVLENGPSSRYIHYFDVDWSSGGAEGKERRILLPILGKPYGETLDSGELKLGLARGEFFIRYYDNLIPLNPSAYVTLLGAVVPLLEHEQANQGAVDEIRVLIASTVGDRERQWNTRFLKQTTERLASDERISQAFDRVLDAYNGAEEESLALLDDLIESQHYRLAYWRMASESINYRRFFDITDLVGVRVEDPEVFEARQGRILKLIDEGSVTGLRIDHIDGLYDPVGYLRRLQNRIDPAWDGEARSAPFYIVVEKIVAPDEPLPDSFACAGTTGYEYLNHLNAVFVDRGGLDELDRIYVSVVNGDALSPESDAAELFPSIAYRSKKRVIDDLFSGEMQKLAQALVALAAHDRNARDFSPGELSRAFVEVTAGLSVYRTYIRSAEVDEWDRNRIENAVDAARARSARDLDPRIFDFLRSVLLVTPPAYLESKREIWLDFVMQWQQFTGRVTAKGIEDTAFYVYNRLLSLNEVGGEPGGEWIKDPVETFHRFNVEQAKRWPANLNTTSTHDTKRSEDFRARINVLSEIAGVFEHEVRSWYDINASQRIAADGRTVPDRNEEYHIYQTLLGMWPLSPQEEPAVADRLTRYLQKATREAKVYSSWLQPDEKHEQALATFATRILADSNSQFRSGFDRLRRTVAWYGMLNSLSQVVLKIASPGVPDFYQGMESWDFSLVDPDNRHPVDYEKHHQMLRSFAESSDRMSLVRQLLENWIDGSVKLFTTATALKQRNRAAGVFASSSYIPLVITGDHARNVIAFARNHEDEWIIAAVPRLLTSVTADGKVPCGGAWSNTALTLPEGTPSLWTNAFTEEQLNASGEIALSRVLGKFPVALLHSTR